VVRVFAPTNESETDSSYYASHTAAFGGLPGDPTVDQGIESRAVQAVVWINITNTSGLGNESAELTDLLAGLVLNNSGNASYQVTNVTSNLSWLTLPPTVLAVLGSRSLPNSGSFGPPVYAGFVNDSGGNFLEEVWNAISGLASFVVHIVEERAVLLVSATLTSQEYIDGAVSGAIITASVGIAKLENQALATLKALQRSMAWALQLALNWVVRNVLEPAFSPLIDVVTTYTTNLATDLVNRNASKFWQDFSSTSFWTLALAVATAIAIALGVFEVLSVGSAFIALLIIGVVIAGVEALGPDMGARFAGDGPFDVSVATELTSLLSPQGGSALSTDLTDLSTLLGAVTTSWAINSVQTAATTPEKYGWTDTWGAAVGIAALLVAGVARAIGSAAAAVVSFFISIGSLVIDMISLLGRGFQSEDEVTLIIDGVAWAIDLSVALPYL
jgi:hypothetical protein